MRSGLLIVKYHWREQTKLLVGEGFGDTGRNIPPRMNDSVTVSTWYRHNRFFITLHFNIKPAHSLFFHIFILSPMGILTT